MKNKIIAVTLLVMACVIASPYVDGQAFLGNDLNMSMKKYSVEFLNDCLEESVKSLVIFESINMLVSFAQDVNIGVSFIGSLEISPGELLDPLNDIVEYISNALINTTIIISVLRLLVEVNQWIAIKVLLPITIGIIAVSMFLKQETKLLYSNIAKRFFILILVLYFIMPISAFLTKQLEIAVMDSVYEKTVDDFKKENIRIKNELERLIKEHDISESALDSIKSFFTNTARTVIGLSSIIVAVFVVKIMLVPLVVLYGLSKASAWLFSGNAISPAMLRALLSHRSGVNGRG